MSADTDSQIKQLEDENNDLQDDLRKTRIDLRNTQDDLNRANHELDMHSWSPDAIMAERNTERADKKHYRSQHEDDIRAYERQKMRLEGLQQAVEEVLKHVKTVPQLDGTQMGGALVDMARELQRSYKQ